MKLILTDYIASLKEDRELDSLLQDLLREYDFEIIYGPQKGVRQYGVDIYAVGLDADDNQKKVFLITVKQGNLDRKNWQGSVQALEPSLTEIATVFVRNNLAPEHRTLPIKIIVAHNGVNEPAIQQNWVAFTEQYNQYQFSIWQLETIVNMVHDRMISEKVLSDEGRMMLRKIIVYLFNPDYDFLDYKVLLDEILNQFIPEEKGKKQNIKLLRKVTLILSIIISYCEREDDSRLGLKASEITLLRFWKLINTNEKLIDKDYFNEFIHMLVIRKNVTLLYLSKILPVCEIKDGFSRHSGDSVTYNMITYEHLGLISLAGLEFLQIGELYENKNDEVVTTLKEYALRCAEGIINLFNNNRIVFNPRADNQVIEINLAFILLMKLEKQNDIRTLLIEFNNELAHAKIFLNIAPLYSNNIDEIFELDINYKKRQEYKYGSSSLLTTLTEWGISINDPKVYDAFLTLIKNVFTEFDLTLWFPDSKTEDSLYTQCALPATGYCLSNIKLTETFEDFKFLTLVDHIHNCPEEEYLFIKNKFWSIGLIASRHYRTYVFPYYWRQFIENSCPVSVITSPEH
ncbi:hypothetical protein CAP36_12495 [Chitinophagaceae bacterium IBVUCB2]|nr:hypothetical protein CAP36_12495 [Chitinophagaceae bacterium IBVUCB2]